MKQRVRFFFANFEEIICVVLLISIYLILLTHVILRYLLGVPLHGPRKSVVTFLFGAPSWERASP